MTQVPADYLSSTSSYNYEQPLPSVARASTITKVPPAKKITFFKSGDPQFAGVKMAINQRSFKSFNALMDDLSHRVPLPFGVRTIATPRGIHYISELDQLEDGGCYLCSDKKYVKPISMTSGRRRPGPPRNGYPSSTLRRAAQEGKLEDYSTPFTQQGPRIPKKITLVKNGESGLRRSIILNRRNARSFKMLLDEISEILHFSVKKLYTVDGKKIDSMQALLHCPSILVCVGREPFKPVSMENLRKHSVEKLPDLAPRCTGNNVNENNEMNFGLKAKKSVIHPRTPSSNRSMRFSLSSEKSYPNGLTASPDNDAPFPNSCSHPKPGDLIDSLINDDIEKRVHVNKDGSLSVEMKVRFRLLNDETLQWSTQIKKSNLMNQMPCEGVEEDSGVDPKQKVNPEASSEAEESLYPCDIDSYMSKLEESECDEDHCHSCGKKHQDYDIWKNPMYISQKEESSVRRTWHARSSCSSTSSRRRVVHKKMASVDSLHTTSSEEFSEHIVQESSSYSETIENRVAYRSIKNCMCRSDLSTGASNGEDQHEYAWTSTSRSQTPSSVGLVSHSSCENNLNTQDAPEHHKARKNNSQNDKDRFEFSSVKCLKDDVEEVESSRVESVMSRSFLQSRQRKKNVCEETSSVGRSMSSSSLQKANQEDNTRCSTLAKSVHSKSGNCTTLRAKSEQDDRSNDNAVVSSFSSESCPKKEAEEVEAGQEENEINEVSSVSAKTKPSQSNRDETSEGEQCTTQGTPYSRASDRNSKRIDRDEVVLCNASCSSRGTKKSKCSHSDLNAQSQMSVSSLESTMNKKNNSLHADDLKSCSKASNYSKSSCEIKTKSIGDPVSHNSGSFHSNISSNSEAQVIAGFTEEKSLKSTTNGYSESSKCSKRRSHREENSKPSSLCSSVSSPNGKAGEGQSKMNSESPSSRHGSMSESVCSKGDPSTETEIRNGNPASVYSRVSSKPEVKDKCLLTQISQESDDRCSQSNISQSSKSRQIKTRNLCANMSNSSQASWSETLSVCSVHCPAPPKGKPNRKIIRPTMLKNSSINSVGTESVLATGKEQKEIDSSKATSYGSKSSATEVNDQKNTEIDDSCNRKVDKELEVMGMQEEGSDLMLSSLPNTSPEEVVQEWLSKIPSETLLMKYEMEDDAEEESIDTSTEVSYCTNVEEISEDEKADKKNVEEAKNKAKDEVGKETAEGTAVNEEAEEHINQQQISEAVSEAAKVDQAECIQSVTSSQNNHRRELPTSVQTSVQIMKALLSSKHETKFDRSNSLPEVSPSMGRKLSNSANILLTCLASLQLLDEESEDPSDKTKHLNKPRYMELLNIFQALWFGCTAEKSGPSSCQEASEQAKTVSGFKASKSVDYDFTPLSSSGVDVSSGSGGSGEESTAAARGCTLTAQKPAEFKSVGQVENAETELAEEQRKEEEQSSRPSTACSKSKGEEKAQSTREESLTQEAEENKKDQCSNCENGQEEGGENEKEENSRLAENGEQEETEALNYELPKENLKEETDQLSATNDANVNDADCGTELKKDLEEHLEQESPNDPKPTVNMATSMGTSLVQENSMDPDPVWVLRLLKKIEKEFMAHYVSAMNEFKVRWNLQNNQQMDVMILELKEEVSRRIQKSIEKELSKIKTRAEKKTPRPPDEPLKRESTIQTEQRRRRLQTMRKKSLFSDKNGTQSRLEDTLDLSFDVDDDTVFSPAFEASINEQVSEEEYCPCDSCVRKKMASKPTRNPVVATKAPVIKAFDLQQILRLKKSDEEACASEAAQDIKKNPSSSVEKAAENGDPNEEDDEGQLQPSETEVEGNEEKEPELNEVGSSTLNEDGEGTEISEGQNCEMEDEAKDEETKEEEKEEAEVEEEIKEREEEEAKEEEEDKEEEEIMKAEEKETKEEADGETKEKEDEELKEEAAEETKDKEEIKEEEEKEKEEEGMKGEEETKEEEEKANEGEETKEEEEKSNEGEETKQEDEDVKEEEQVIQEEEVKEEEEETKKEEEENMKEEEEERKEEEEEEVEVKSEEEETKKEADMEEEKEGTKEEEDIKEEEETKVEEDKVQVDAEVTQEDEEAKEDEEETTQEGQEVQEDKENPKEEDEEATEEKEGAKDEEETKEHEEEANEEEQEEETKNEEQEAEEKTKAENEVDNEAEAAEEPEDEDIRADDEEETPECRGDADGSGTDNKPEGDAAEGSEETEKDESEAVEDANPESEDEACLAEEENNSEGGDKYDETASDDCDKAHEKHKDKGDNKVSKKALKAKVKKNSKRLETLNKPVTFSCYSSMGNFSQQSQKGSEDEGEEECKDDNRNNHPNGGVQSDESSKPSQMYPDSEEEEAEKASSCTDPLGDEDQADAEGAGPKVAEHTDEVQASKKEKDSGEIDQDDLDF